MPQIGQNRGDGPSAHEDFGRERVTGQIGDRFSFRTPTLRNVALTGHWGHTGVYNTLDNVVQHHLDPVNALYNYDTSQAVLPSRPDLDTLDFLVMSDSTLVGNIAAANQLQPTSLIDKEYDQMMDFLHALTDPDALDLRSDMPMRVPSGLPLAD